MRTEVELDPDVADEAPRGSIVTAYDEQHYVTYLDARINLARFVIS